PPVRLRCDSHDHRRHRHLLSRSGLETEGEANDVIASGKESPCGAANRHASRSDVRHLHHQLRDVERRAVPWSFQVSLPFLPSSVELPI
ncbi:hypothetical protein PENTCL1PPCAC_13798, partial [Pristionchus entomophagus]